jgi:hypothetical protein
MPYQIRENPDGTFRVTGPSGIHARKTTKKKAEAQVRLLHMKEQEKLDWDTDRESADRLLRKSGHR